MNKYNLSSNFSASTVEYGGIAFLLDNADTYMPYLILYCMGFLIGCTGKNIHFK